MNMVQHEEQAVFLPTFPGAHGLNSCYDTVVRTLQHRHTTFNTALNQLTHHAFALSNAAERLIATLQSGHKVLIAGNGGSAAEAQHFAAELVGRFKRERLAYPVMALTTDTSTLTAVANDYGYHNVFARQVQAFGQTGDLFIAFSTSGESENLVRAACIARQKQLEVIAVTGNRTNRLEEHATVAIHVPVEETATTQELHMIVTHILCDITEARLAAEERFNTQERQ
ncbi:hypothetical protein KSC_096430 [Ktedonobacter sp. SOSP1-52]|nr:hypothetical protein KSC_096430 [Ktedonobacter sp. SOSP1-52]